MSHPETNKSGISLNRRGFLKATGILGAGLAIAPTILGEEAKNASKTVNVAFIGVGTQGRVLLTNALKIPNVKFVGVTDVWPYHQGYATRLLKKYQHNANGYADHMEMLDKEKELDAVIIATPDWKHAEHTIACLKAGKHVYCEKEMSNSLELAKQMVTTSKETKKLLQIGHQRRSNPRYHAAFDFVAKKKACGKMGFVSAQWNRAKRLDVGWPKDQELDAAALAKLGYESMQKFRNWRWYKKYSGGPIADLGSHQIDIFNWYLGASPRAVMASGGMDWSEGIEWYDNINAIYEWEVPAEGGKKRIVRGFYQTVTPRRSSVTKARSSSVRTQPSAASAASRKPPKPSGKKNWPSRRPPPLRLPHPLPRLPMPPSPRRRRTTKAASRSATPFRPPAATIRRFLPSRMPSPSTCRTSKTSSPPSAKARRSTARARSVTTRPSRS
jgi:predicted dehydrogenase